MTDAVDQTLHVWRTTEFVWGQSDCILSGADHVMRVTGIDPAHHWRGQYDTEEAACAALSAVGGIIAAIDSVGALTRSEVPQRGDIVAVRIGEQHVTGLHTGEGVAFRLERGVKEIDAGILNIEASWRI